MNLGDKPLKDVTLRELMEAMVFATLQGADWHRGTPYKEQIGWARHSVAAYLSEQAKYAESKPFVYRWTQEAPLVTGTYWLRREQDGRWTYPFAVQVYHTGAGEWMVAYFGTNKHDKVEEISGAWWYGPLCLPPKS